MGQIKSKERVSSHGEVFTNKREVCAMLDMVQSECGRIESWFFERITTKLIRLTGALSLGEVLRGVGVSHSVNWGFVGGNVRNVKR